MKASKIILILMLVMCCTQQAGAQSTSSLLDNQVAIDDLKIIEELGVLMGEGDLDVDAYIQAVLFLTAGEETEVKYQGTYREVIEIAEKLAVEAGNKQGVVVKSALITPTSTELIKDSDVRAIFKLNFQAKNQLDTPLYGLDLGVNTYLVDGSDGYGSTGVDEFSKFQDNPIAAGETRKGLYVIVMLEYDHESEDNSIYGMNAVIENLKTLEVKFWELPIYDCRTKEGWMLYGDDE